MLVVILSFSWYLIVGPGSSCLGQHATGISAWVSPPMLLRNVRQREMEEERERREQSPFSQIANETKQIYLLYFLDERE